MKVSKGIMLRVKPNASQREKLERHFGHNRFLWNHFLAKRREDYQRDKITSNYYKDAAELTKLKQQPEFAWLYEASTASEQRTLKHLDDAYKRFFKGHAHFPRFKSKRAEQAFTLSGGISIRGNRICIPKFQEGLRFARDLPPFLYIHSATVKKAADGAFYVILSVAAEVGAKPATGNAVGIDLGLIDFAVLSNGKRIKHPKFLKAKLAALRRAQRHLSRKKKGSKRRDVQRRKVAAIQRRIANSRRDFHHKASAFVVNSFDTIAVENLAVKNMIRNRSLSRSIADAGWSQFLMFLSYKAKWYGRELLEVGRFFPSSKTCGECGFIAQSLPLDVREWECPACAATLDRDVNAANNILREALRSGRQFPITGAEAA